MEQQQSARRCSAWRPRSFRQPLQPRPLAARCGRPTWPGALVVRLKRCLQDEALGIQPVLGRRQAGVQQVGLQLLLLLRLLLLLLLLLLRLHILCSIAARHPRATNRPLGRRRRFSGGKPELRARLPHGCGVQLRLWAACPAMSVAGAAPAQGPASLRVRKWRWPALGAVRWPS